MLVLSTQATAFAATCYVLAAGPGEPCVVVDPGAGTAPALARLVAEHELTPAGVAATHGHPDHLWDAAELVERWQVPFFLGAADLDRLADPVGSLGPGLREAFEALAGSAWRAPGAARPYPAGTLDLIPGLPIGLLPAPGHTPGSTILLAAGTPSAASVLPATVTGRPLPATTALALTGDVLFAGAAGRTDLPGGHGPTMTATLGGLAAALPADAWVLPGHGPISTMALERARNPYLDPAWLARGVF